MFIATKTVSLCLPNGKTIQIVKDQEVKQGVVNKCESYSPGFIKRYTVEMSDNYIQRQNRWLKVAEADSKLNFLWTIITQAFIDYMPKDRKVGQWCVGKQNMVSNQTSIEFEDIIKTIPNEYVNSSHNWDGSYTQIILDDNKIDEITSFINKKAMLALM